MNPNLTDINAAAESVPKFSDIQGLILRGYNLPFVRYIIFTINNVDGARRFCKDILPGSSAPMHVTTALPWEHGIKPDYCLNVGFTASGLEKMITKTNFNKVSGWSLDFFSAFKAGAIKTAARIGDIGESAPDQWWKGDGWIPEDTDPAPDGSDLHIQVTLFAHDSESLNTYYNTLLGMVPGNADDKALSVVFFKDSEPLAQGDDYIHFGYKDSFSQPRLTDVPWNTTQGRLRAGKSTVDDRPVVPINQFVIGITKVSVDPQPLRYNPHPLLENGSFAAFRLLYQDVAAFNKFINSAKDGTPPELVAAKMCGRWFDGTPLVVSPDKPNPDLKDFDYTNFNYITPTDNQQGIPKNDDLGQLCPYAAHIRRANPRDDEKVKGNNGLAANAKTRRIMRRAGPYGPDYKDTEVAKKDGGIEVKRGLVGLFICANLTQQFIFIMDSWINHGGFRSEDKSDNGSGVDPLFGPSKNDFEPNNEFDYLPDGATDQPYKRITGIERFIRTDGSLFLFLPGMAGLENIANGTLPTLH